MNDAIPTVLRGNLVLLKAGTLSLLLPQPEVGAAEHLTRTPRATPQPGWFELDEDRAGTRRVAALSAQLALLPQWPAQRFVLTALLGRPGEWLAWNDVRVLMNAELRVLPLPPVMLGPHSPLRAMVELGDELAFVCSGATLQACCAVVVVAA